jgi:hypothetical protein
VSHQKGAASGKLIRLAPPGGPVTIEVTGLSLKYPVKDNSSPIDPMEDFRKAGRRLARQTGLLDDAVPVPVGAAAMDLHRAEHRHGHRGRETAHVDVPHMSEKKTDDEKKQDTHEKGYIEGSRWAWMQVLQQAIQHLGGGTDAAATAAKGAAWILERQDVVSKLHTLCDRVGADDDWDDDHHLGDVIDNIIDHWHSEND